ncbi:alpha/beta fold hydrolase [Streptosporangium lutulentum]|uniref:Pimeloyl-ACP methyl ester carboxylesterase n=1 Tax=Streptosporangium lutulentum TaxID=1461250 RepID=A0ABT9QDV5_9ACTN|nr:alpha/beta fold hydrolase [Streptosporangium lutulentum]MDP9844903.1 pimeloyl-ACP methyl ester carboxylesterase [Streptosporangium lutulentum]
MSRSDRHAERTADPDGRKHGGPTDGSVPVPGAGLAYTAEGEGDVVLYAHGLTSSRAADAARGLVDYRPVASRSRLIAYDARGHGRSTGSPREEDYRWTNLARDMLAIADHFSPDRPIGVIGASMGTATVLHAVLLAPHRFSRLVLTTPPTAWERRAAQAGQYRRMAELAAADPGALVTALRNGPVPAALEGTAYSGDPDVSPALLPHVLAGAASSDLPAPEALAALRVPTLILTWDTDPSHPVETARRLAEVIPGSQLHISTNADDVTGWAERAVEFLRRTNGEVAVAP